MTKKQIIIIAISLLTVITIITTFLLNQQNNQSYSTEDSFISLSDEELSAILIAERDSITSAINSRFSSFTANYTINQIELFGKGQYCGVTLIYSDNNSGEEDTYRLILYEKDNIWHVNDIPKFVLSYREYPDLPKQVIKQVNNL